MNIQLDENYRLTNDTEQWILEYSKTGEVNPKTGRPKLSVNRWYCSSLQNALLRYRDESCKTSESIEELIVKMEEVKSVIKSLKI